MAAGASANLEYGLLRQFSHRVTLPAFMSVVDQPIGRVLNRRFPRKMKWSDACGVAAGVRRFMSWCGSRSMFGLADDAVSAAHPTRRENQCVPVVVM